MNTCSTIPALAQEQINRIASECSGKDIKVVISCITYNHGPYLADALDGFVKQQTNFPFVAIVHDDASTNNTADVLREYAERYPDIIKPIYEKENQYSKGNGSLDYIVDMACKATEAPYIAFCEGDDFWTDSNKLQKQVDFLDGHPDYSMCFHNARIIQIDGRICENGCAMDVSREYTADQIMERFTVHTATVVCRSWYILFNPIRYNTKFKYGDLVLFLTCAKYGKLYGFIELMSVYRKNPTSITMRLINAPWLKLDVVHTREQNKVFSEILSRNIRRDVLASKYFDLMRQVKGNTKELIRYTMEGLWYCSPEIWKYFGRAMKRKSKRLR